MKILGFHIIILCSLLFSCVQITESPIEGDQWTQSGSHLGKDWEITKDGKKLEVKIDDLDIQLYPTIRVGNITLARCGLSSVGPASKDFEFELPEHGFFYNEQPYAFSFKLDNAMNIYTLSQENSSQGKLYLQSKISINFLSKKLSIEETVHNSKGAQREVQFGYLINTENDSSYISDYQTIFPLNEQGQNELEDAASFDSPPSFCGLRKNKSETYYSSDDRFIKISHPDLPYVSQLGNDTQMISNSYYQPRNLARQLGRIPLMAPYRELIFKTKISFTNSAPAPVKNPEVDNNLESLADLDIEQ